MTHPHVYRRHRSARSLVRAFWPGLPVDEDLLRAVVRHGKWAFVKTPMTRRGPNGKPNPHKKAEIHYWIEPGHPPDRIAMMLGHELGHITGKAARGAAAEEDRADLYGSVAREVFCMMTKRRTTRRRLR